MKIYKLNKFNNYIFFSLIIHASIFLLSYKEKDILLGDKIIPVEIIDINSISSKGEYFKKNEQQVNRTFQDNLNKLKTQEKFVEEVENQRQNEASALKKEHKKSISKQNNRNNKSIGSIGLKNTNKVEKGSIKGKGIEKITCLSCTRPVYPKYALKKRLGGNVMIKVWIKKDGKVEKSNVIISSGIDVIDKSAIKAAERSRFYPLKKATTLNIEYELKIK